jgi:precorrin-6B methylase 2
MTRVAGSCPASRDGQAVIRSAPLQATAVILVTRIKRAITGHVVILGSSLVIVALAEAEPSLRATGPEVPYVATPEPVVAAMLELAKVSSADVLYDLGSGDGRIVITAARDFGSRGTGIDIDPERIREARENAKRARVADRVRFVQHDVFHADISEATVVTLYLSPELNRRLRPKLLSELRPGTRVVSHRYDLGDWAPQRSIQVIANGVSHWLFYWVVPGRQ